ncbi:MAG: hypothetical protein HEP71_02210 [Roseivirga sp.]|nr:hypothetical protein [Roseivirga sp.]
MEQQIIFIIVTSSMMFLMAFGLMIKGKRVLRIFPSLFEVQVVFREKGVSGGSLGSLMSRMGGTRKGLEVVVTTEELWIKPIPIVAGFSDTLDNVHKIELRDIINTEVRGNTVLITFKTQSTQVKKVSLILKAPTAFLEALKQ